MSFEDGWSAINLEMPRRVPRTEYSVEGHWGLISEVTGIAVDEKSPDTVKKNAQARFTGPDCWNFDFFWSTLVSSGDLKKLRTSMGHAEYAAGGVDRNDNLTCPFTEPEQVLALQPYDVYGRLDRERQTRAFEDHYRRNCANRPDGVNMTGIYITLISGLIEIFGWEMLLTAAGTDPRAFGELAGRYAAWIGQYFEALAAADVPIVMIHDDIVWTEGPFLPPAWYREYVFPNYKRLFAPLRDSGKKIMFTSDGNYTAFVDDIAACGVHGFVMEPTTDMKFVAGKYGRTHVFIGNADTRILLHGTKERIRAEVERCMAIGKPYPGFFMAVGNHIPSNTPVENAVYYNDVYRDLSRR